MKSIDKMKQAQAALQKKLAAIHVAAKTERANRLLSVIVNELKIPRSTMKKAHNLQREYDALGSAGTQRIRNPFSIGHIIYAILARVSSAEEIQLEGVTVHEIHRAFKSAHLITNYVTISATLRHLVLAKMISKAKEDRFDITNNRKHAGKPRFIYFVKA